MARQPGVYGPYKHGNRWRLVVLGRGGGQTAVTYATREEAVRAKEKADAKRNQAAGLTVRKAIEEYEKYMLRKGNKLRSVETTRGRLYAFFADKIDRQLASLTEDGCKQLYNLLADRKRVIGDGEEQHEKPTASDTHMNTLNQAKTFLNWCVSEGYLKRNPAGALKGVGKRRKGKAQLRNEEARRFFAKAKELADGGDVAGVAAMASLLLGTRATELLSRPVRDLDDDGHLLWIPDSKTEAGRRTLEVADVLRPYLLELAKGKAPDDLLFGDYDRHWLHHHVERICKLAGVPVVCSHSLRGLHGSASREAGTTGHAVAAALGHASYEAVTKRNYVAPGVDERVKQRAVLRVIEGGK